MRKNDKEQLEAVKKTIISPLAFKNELNKLSKEDLFIKISSLDREDMECIKRQKVCGNTGSFRYALGVVPGNEHEKGELRHIDYGRREGYCPTLPFGQRQEDNDP